MIPNVHLVVGDAYASDADLICIPANTVGLSDAHMQALKGNEPFAYEAHVEAMLETKEKPIFGGIVVADQTKDANKCVALLYCRRLNYNEALATSHSAMLSCLEELLSAIPCWWGRPPINTIAISLDEELDGIEITALIREFLLGRPYRVTIYWHPKALPGSQQPHLQR